MADEGKPTGDTVAIGVSRRVMEACVFAVMVGRGMPRLEAEGVAHVVTCPECMEDLAKDGGSILNASMRERIATAQQVAKDMLVALLALQTAGVLSDAARMQVHNPEDPAAAPLKRQKAAEAALRRTGH